MSGRCLVDRSRLRGPAAVVVLLAGMLAACGGDDEATVTAGTVVVDDSGGGEAFTLPAAFVVGQAASISAEFTSTVAASGSGIDEEYTVTLAIGYDTEVVSLTDEGGAVVESEFVSAEVVEAPTDAGIDAEAITDLVGVRYRETYAADGSVLETELVDEDSLSDAQQAAANDMIGQASTSTITFPAEPVGVGATWSSDSTLRSQGIDIVVVDRYELVAVDDGIYTITVDYGAPIEDELSGDEVTGSISATGTIRGAIDNPLAVTSSLTQTVDMQLEGQGTIEMTVDVATVAEGVAPLDEAGDGS